MRFDGEKDTKSPIDFTHGKPDDNEDDDDHPDEDEELTVKSKKRPEVKAKPKVEKPVASSSRMTDTEVSLHSTRTPTQRLTEPQDEHKPSTSRSRRSPPPQIASISSERHSKHAPEHDDYPPPKRARTSSYTEELRASEARNFLAHPGIHPFHALAAQQPYNLPVANSPYNPLYGPGIGSQSPQLFDFLRNPNNLRALSGAYGQSNIFGRPPGVSDGFLQSLGELAAQQSAGAGVGCVGAGGFEWPGGYANPPLHPGHGDQGAESSWLDFLTGAPQGSIPPPTHLPNPYGQNHHSWSSPGSRRSDSSMSDFDGPGVLGGGIGAVIPPRLGAPIRPQSRDVEDSL
jgi:hypothetical protein